MLHVTSVVNDNHAQIRISNGQAVEWRSSGIEFKQSSSDFAAFAALPAAMLSGERLHVDGDVDDVTVRNATLLSHFWAQWKPSLYRPVSVSAEHVVHSGGPHLPPTNDAVACVSGGVDSTYALVHAAADPSVLGWHGARIAHGVFVAGFDYAPEDSGVASTLSAIQSVASTVGVEVSVVETDWRSALCSRGKASWDHVHTMGLAAILHLCSGQSAFGVLASDYTFREDNVVAPWSSNAATNRMLGSRSFEIIPVGENASRIDKIAAIAGAGLLAHMRVCWAGPRTGGNCSHCEKCLRTMLMCEALGVDPTPAFGRRPTVRDISGLVLRSVGQIAFVRQAVNRPDSRLSPSLKAAAIGAITHSRMRLPVKAAIDPLRAMLRRDLPHDG